MQRRRALHRVVELVGHPRGLIDDVGPGVAVVRTQLLPVDRHHPVPLEVAECAVVHQHVESVEGPLEGTTGLVAAVLALAHVRPYHRESVLDPHRGDPTFDLILGQMAVYGYSIEATILISASGSKSTRRTSGRRVGHRARGEQGLGQLGGVLAGVLEILAPDAASVGAVDALEERRDDLAELSQHQIGVVACLGQRMGAHAQQQRLVGLPVP